MKVLVYSKERWQSLAYCTGLENQRAATYRGFESLPLRQFTWRNVLPLYRYKCENCETEFEKLISMKDRYSKEVEIICPNCGSSNVQSIIHKPSFSLKGGGWYSDGYTKKE